MKTTLIIPEALYKQVKQTMAHKGLNFRETVFLALKQFLDSQKAEKKTYKWNCKPFDGDGLVDDLKGRGWDDIRTRLYEGRGG